MTRRYADAMRRLKQAGLRPTRQRLSVLSMLLETAPRHVTAEELAEWVIETPVIAGERYDENLIRLLIGVLALAFVFGSLRSAGAGGRLMIGVIVGLAYYLASETLSNSGQVFNINPIIVSWLPSLVLLLITVYALARIR